MRNTVEIHGEPDNTNKIQIGQYYIDTSTSQIYILHYAEEASSTNLPKVTLVNILTGSLFADPVKVCDVRNISMNEFDRITNEDPDIRKLITPFTITPRG